jgi:hypothetical protein
MLSIRLGQRWEGQQLINRARLGYSRRQGSKSVSHLPQLTVPRYSLSMPLDARTPWSLLLLQSASYEPDLAGSANLKYLVLRGYPPTPVASGDLSRSI